MTTKEKEELSVDIGLDKARQNRDDIIKAKFNVAANYLVLAKLLKDNRDNAYWKLEGCESFEDFLGSPEIAFSRAKAYGLIHLWELYKDKLALDDHTILDIGTSKLALIAPVVESDKEGWLTKAKELSKSDLRLELGQGSGKEIGPPPKISPPSPASAPSSCCVCGSMQWEKHHWPITRGAGAEDGWWIPLCRVCHSSCHHEPKDWTWEHKRSWAKYLYGMINRE